MNGRWLVAGLVVLALWGAMRHPFAVEQPAGVIAPASPVQHDLQNAPPFDRDGYRYQPVATFDLNARVLSVEHYRFDRGAALAPVDVAFGWGRMSDSSVLARLQISQSGRWYQWRFEGDEPIPTDEIYASSANMHLIPANDAVELQLDDLRPGQVVSLRGRLVDVRKTDGSFWWNTSRTRLDRGGGACELVYVDSVSVR